jgi:hypothetical protein
LFGGPGEAMKRGLSSLLEDTEPSYTDFKADGAENHPKSDHV